MTREALPLVMAVKDNIAQGEFYLESFSDAEDEDREAIEDQFREAYIEEYAHGSCPVAWIDNDLMQAIIHKFKYVLEAVTEEAISSSVLKLL